MSVYEQSNFFLIFIIEMSKCFINLILVCSFFSCKKDVGIPNEPPHPTCPVTHILDVSKNGSMKDTWRFVGFQKENSEQIDSPPCDVPVYDDKGTLLFNFPSGAQISFPDTLAYSWEDSMYISYSHRYVGSVRNSFRGGCEYDNSNLSLGPAMQTLAYGPELIMDFEDRFHTVLRMAKTYQINHNLLTINCGTSGKMLFVLK